MLRRAGLQPLVTVERADLQARAAAGAERWATVVVVGESAESYREGAERGTTRAFVG